MEAVVTRGFVTQPQNNIGMESNNFYLATNYAVSGYNLGIVVETSKVRIWCRKQFEGKACLVALSFGSEGSIIRHEK